MKSHLRFESDFLWEQEWRMGRKGTGYSFSYYYYKSSTIWFFKNNIHILFSSKYKFNQEHTEHCKRVKQYYSAEGTTQTSFSPMHSPFPSFNLRKIYVIFLSFFLSFSLVVFACFNWFLSLIWGFSPKGSFKRNFRPDEL